MKTKETPEVATKEWFAKRDAERRELKLMKLSPIVCIFCALPGILKNEQNETFCVQCALEEASEITN